MRLIVQPLKYLNSRWFVTNSRNSRVLRCLHVSSRSQACSARCGKANQLCEFVTSIIVAVIHQRPADCRVCWVPIHTVISKQNHGLRCSQVSTDHVFMKCESENTLSCLRAHLRCMKAAIGIGLFHFIRERYGRVLILWLLLKEVHDSFHQYVIS